MSLTDRQIEVLAGLFMCRDRWVTPMMIGGRDQSHHAATLVQLAKRGLVERLKSHAIYCGYGTYYAYDVARGKVVRLKKPIARCVCKGSCRYRITKEGSRVLRRARRMRA